MKDLKKAIFYSDLDGTLLNNKALLSAQSKSNLKKIIEHGLLFGIASARNLTTIATMFDGIVPSLPVISLNGAYISDLKTMKHVRINAIERRVVHAVLDYIDKANISSVISCHHEGEDRIMPYKLSNEGELWYLDYCKADKSQVVIDVQDLDQIKSNLTTCFTFIDRKENLDRIRLYLEENHSKEIEMHIFENQYSKGWYWLTVHSHLATKSNAIQYVIDHYNHAGKHLTVFGDGVNDIKMFKLADTAIAVNNADVSVKAQADLVISDNIDDSVTNYLMELIATN